jgi:hypothetical protein
VNALSSRACADCSQAALLAADTCGSGQLTVTHVRSHHGPGSVLYSLSQRRVATRVVILLPAAASCSEGWAHRAESHIVADSSRVCINWCRGGAQHV